MKVALYKNFSWPTWPRTTDTTLFMKVLIFFFFFFLESTFCCLIMFEGTFIQYKGLENKREGSLTPTETWALSSSTKRNDAFICTYSLRNKAQKSKWNKSSQCLCSASEVANWSTHYKKKMHSHEVKLQYLLNALEAWLLPSKTTFKLIKFNHI